MASTGLFIAVLDPEYAFEDVQETVETNLGMVYIDGYKLKFLLEPEDKDATLPDVFGVIYSVVKAFLSTLAWVTEIPVGFKPFDYLELVDNQLRPVPIRFRQPQAEKVNNMHLEATRHLLPHVLSDSTLRWALEDYRTALRESGHEIIFLFRSIEWLKVRFGGWEEAWTAIGSSEKEFGAMKKPANDYRVAYLARHAHKGGPRPVPQQVLEDAFKNTRIIVQKYMDYLRSEVGNGT